MNVAPLDYPTILRSLLAPMVMVAGVATMNWGLQIAQSNLINRIRLLNDVRRDLQTGAPRLAQLDQQLGWLTRRAHYLRNAVTGFFAAAIFLLLCSAALALIAVFDSSLTWPGTALFEAGLLCIIFALTNVIRDVHLSFRAVAADTQDAITGGSHV